MNTTFTTLKGAKVGLELVGTEIMVFVNGSNIGKMNTIQDHPMNGRVIRVFGFDGMIGIPPAADADVVAIDRAKGQAIAAAYAASDEGRLHAQMARHESHDDDGLDRAERVWG